jgi:hypothetical protein
MPKTIHTSFSRTSKAPGQLPGATVSVSGSVISLSGISSLSATTTGSVTANASSVVGGNATVTLGGNPRPADTVTLTINGITFQAIAPGARTPSAIAAELAGGIQLAINGDLLGYFGSNQRVTTTTTTKATCATPGLAMSVKTDQRPTTPGANGLPTIDDAETTVP